MIWILLLVYQIKHFLADYPLQGKYMLGKFKPFPHFILPLSAHALVHAAFTFAIAFTFYGYWKFLPQYALIYSAALGLFDGATHFVVDFLKANPKIGGRWAALSKREMMEEIENQKYFAEYPLSDVTKQTKALHDNRLKSNVYFWWALGADQMAHHLTHYIIIYMLVR